MYTANMLIKILPENKWPENMLEYIYVKVKVPLILPTPTVTLVFFFFFQGELCTHSCPEPPETGLMSQVTRGPVRKHHMM